MFTPTRKRSLKDHREYYEKVKPKVVTRWENGTPRMRGGKFVCNRIQRRMSDTFLIQPRNYQTPPSSRPVITHEEEDEVFGTPEGTAPSTEVGVQDLNIVSLTSSSRKMESVRKQFGGIITRLETRMKNKECSDAERFFITQQVKEFTSSVNQVEFLMRELTGRATRLEVFLANRDKGLDWNYWQN